MRLIVNRAGFTIGIIPDHKYSRYDCADDITIRFGPPLGTLLQSGGTKGSAVPAIPVGAVGIKFQLPIYQFTPA